MEATLVALGKPENPGEVYHEFEFTNFFFCFVNANWFAGVASILSGKCGMLEQRSRLSGGTEKPIPKDGRFVPLPNAERNKNESTVPEKTS